MRKVSWVLLIAMTISVSHAQTVKVVGIGTAPCATFLTDILWKPASEGEYISWAQGYMSGILMRAPPGEDENLDLISSAFPVRMQLTFFRDYCAKYPKQTYADAAESLYARLREFAKR